MIIEIMAKKHIKQISEIERQCFKQPWSEKSLKEELINKNARFFVMTEDDKVVGYIGCHFVLDEGYITNVAVAKESRRKAIASKLVCKIIDTAQEEKLNFVSLEVRKSNFSAIALYEKHGFEKVGERKDFYENPTENALIMNYQYR